MTEYLKWKPEWNLNTVLTLLLIIGVIVGFFRWTNGIENANTQTNSKFDNAVSVIQNWISRHETDIAKRREDSERRNGQLQERAETMQRAIDKGDADTERMGDRVTALEAQSKAILDRMDRQLDAINQVRDDLNTVKANQEVLTRTLGNNMIERPPRELNPRAQN